MAFLGFRTPSSSATSFAEKLGSGLGQGVTELMSGKLKGLQKQGAYKEFLQAGYPEEVARLFSMYHDRPEIFKLIQGYEPRPQNELQTSAENQPQEQQISQDEQAIASLLGQQPQQIQQPSFMPNNTIQAAPFEQNPFNQINNPLTQLAQLFRQPEQQNALPTPAQEAPLPRTQEPVAKASQAAAPLSSKQLEQTAKKAVKIAPTFKKTGNAADAKLRNEWIDGFTQSAQKAESIVNEMDDLIKLVSHPSFKTGFNYQIGKTVTGLSDANTRVDKILARIGPQLAAVQQGSGGRITNQMLDAAFAASPNPYQMSKESMIAAANSIKDMFGVEPIQYADAATKLLRTNKDSSVADLKLAVNDQLRSTGRQRYSIAQGLEPKSYKVGQELNSLPANPVEGMELTNEKGQKAKYFNNDWHAFVNGKWQKIGK